MGERNFKNKDSDTHYTCKNAQVVTGLQTSCYKSVPSQVVNKLCSHCLFPVVGITCSQLVTSLISLSDL
jgi:hypothetical protein